MTNPLREQFGQIDIYLFDQLLRGNIHPGMVVFDAGCGYGRNIRYMLSQGYDVFGADAEPEAIVATRRMAASLAPSLPPENFRVEHLESLTFPPQFADVVMVSAVLHFARDSHHFDLMVRGAWRALKPGGMFFCRLASSIGIEYKITSIHDRRFRLPDGSERYLVDEAMLMHVTGALGGSLIDPLKTTVVQNQRSMTTWVVRKDA